MDRRSFFATFGAFFAQNAPPLQLEQTIPLNDVEGRIDHLAADLKNKRLFVAALGNNTVEVIDLAAGRRIYTITDLKEPQGAVYLADAARLLVTNGGDGTLRAYAGSSFRLIASVQAGADADNIRYDAADALLYVGYGGGALASLDAASLARRGEVTLEGHPESFQLDRSGVRIFVNVPKAGHVAIIDRRKRAVVGAWPVPAGIRENYPMALDEAGHLLFVGCRKPPKVVVYDTQTGNPLVNFDISGDTDDLFFDSAHKRLYVSCGEGYVDVFEQRGARSFQHAGKIPTMPGARTSLFVPELDRYYVALRNSESRTAEIRVYRVLSA